MSALNTDFSSLRKHESSPAKLPGPGVLVQIRLVVKWPAMCILSFAAATRALISVWRYWLVFRLHPISSSLVTLGAVGSRTGFRICWGLVVRQDPSLMCWLSSSQGYWPKSQLLESWADSKSLCKSVRLRTVICFHLVSGYLCSLAPLETCLSWRSTGVFPLISAGLRVFQFYWTTTWFQLC